MRILDIDKIYFDIHELVPSNYEFDDLKWRPDETMMQFRIYKLGKLLYDAPPFYQIKKIDPMVQEAIIKYLEDNNLEYEFGTDSEYFDICGRVPYTTLRIWGKEELEDEDDMFEGYIPPKSDFEETGLYNANHSNATEFDIIDALSYMKGISAANAKRNLYKGEYTKEEIQKALLYWATEGLPASEKQEFANSLYKEFGLVEDKKKKNAASFFYTLYPGDPEKNAEVFNNSTSDDCKFSEIAESFDDSNWMYLSDVIEGMMGNASDDDIDNDLKLFKRIAQKLHVRNIDDVVVLIDTDVEYDPDYFVTEVGQKIGPIYKNNNDVVEYEMFGAHLISEKNCNGLFLYFPDTTSAKRFIDAVDGLNESLSKSKQLTEANNKESANRTNLINKIKSFGKNYDFSKYTDQQLFRIANRLQDAKDIEDVMKEFAEKRKQGEQERQYDTEYDIPDETYVEEKLSIREKLGRLDEQCLDTGKYLDLRNLFEAVSPTMTPDEKEELRKVVNSTNDPEIISAYLNGKYKEKDESLQEDFESNLFRKLEWAVGDFLEFCESVEWAFPEGLIFDGWRDWIDDNAMSPSEESVESAETLLSRYKHLYEVNKGLQDHGVDDWETEAFLELYENMRSAYDAAIEE